MNLPPLDSFRQARDWWVGLGRGFVKTKFVSGECGCPLYVLVAWERQDRSVRDTGGDWTFSYMNENYGWDDSVCEVFVERVDGLPRWGNPYPAVRELADQVIAMLGADL